MKAVAYDGREETERWMYTLNEHQCSQCILRCIHLRMCRVDEWTKTLVAFSQRTKSRYRWAVAQRLKKGEQIKRETERTSRAKQENERVCGAGEEKTTFFVSSRASRRNFVNVGSVMRDALDNQHARCWSFVTLPINFACILTILWETETVYHGERAISRTNEKRKLMPPSFVQRKRERERESLHASMALLTRDFSSSPSEKQIRPR